MQNRERLGCGKEDEDKEVTDNGRDNTEKTQQIQGNRGYISYLS